MITMTINGKPVEVPSNLTIGGLLKNQNVESPQMVSVELNEEIIPRNEYESIRLKNNDRVEFLYFMGGGMK